MVSYLRSRKIEDHSIGLKELVTPSMISYMEMGFNTTGRWIKKILYYLFNKVKIQGFLSVLVGSLNDDSAWIIDSGLSRHITG